ncbi:Dpi35p KNAG_0E02190 [Huiozyma naganishii CBS 8797]|uniref:Uncharacterized protein n=1 Tax=Huiozyma naganishii (strain ATCC MYA-139 / BCRC 22969 / CBS 8797 / KCTC 17520 / NBRC 10181 / NCYC 3082 / Yp74L-3) TaxID=1071383 RepID=J7R6L8_HUIN7|nr:hypothetical protein KNAG_0E02190 [Kazachstania naganishii CBS 8797]CCK70480.1 hypothetical protein KNAG_0E02190 [Kazachstania naganishii CBS 8797]
MTYPKKMTLPSQGKIEPPVLPPKLITFDAYNTLYCSTTPIMEQYSAIALKYGIKVPVERLNERFRKTFQTLNDKYPNYGKHFGFSANDWWARLIRQVFLPTEVPESLVDDILERVLTKEGFIAYPDIIDFVKEVKGRFPDVIIGVVSNTDPDCYELLRQLGLFDYFKGAVYLSYDIELFKPDPKLFDYVVSDVVKRHPGIIGEGDSIKTFRRHCWHVGDEFKKDLLAAQKAGWNAVLVDRLNRNGLLNDLEQRSEMTEHDLYMDKLDQHAEKIWDHCRDQKHFVQLNETSFVVPNITVLKQLFLAEG